MLLFRRLKTWRFTFRQRGVRANAEREREQGQAVKPGFFSNWRRANFKLFMVR